MREEFANSDPTLSTQPAAGGLLFPTHLTL